jgi:hypothetical protein
MWGGVSTVLPARVQKVCGVIGSKSGLYPTKPIAPLASGALPVLIAPTTVRSLVPPTPAAIHHNLLERCTCRWPNPDPDREHTAGYTLVRNGRDLSRRAAEQSTLLLQTRTLRYPAPPPHLNFGNVPGSTRTPRACGNLSQPASRRTPFKRPPGSPDRRRFVAQVRGTLADDIERGEPLQPVRLRERIATREVKDREPLTPE